MVVIRIEETTKNRLDVIKDQLKKRRKGRISHDDAIQSLFKKIKDLKAENKTLQQGIPTAKPSLEGEKEDGKTPLNSLSREPAPPQTPLMTHPPCPFFTLGEDVVMCGKDYDKKGVVHKVPEDVCMQCWQRNKDILAPQIKPDTEKVECLCRYEHAGKYFCVKNPPRAVPLAHNLKTCLACPDRLTKDKAEHRGLILRTHEYVTCGSKENMDPKVGLMLYCDKEGGRWVTIAHCKKIECEFLKTVQTT